MNELNILLIDDDLVDVETVKRAMRRRGISNAVTVAGDGIEALHVLLGDSQRAPLPSPRLILLDLMMPRMDGFEFLEELRHHPQFDDDPVFVLTTSDDESHRAEAHRLGISGYIVKGELPLAALDLVLQGLQAVPLAEVITVDVGTMVHELVTELDPQGRMDLKMSSSLLLLETAGMRLKQVLRCLIENAIEHHDRDHGVLSITWEEVNEQIGFRVMDDGPGVSPGRVREIFRPLVTTKPMETGPQRVGQGMGLPLARHIVEDAGGVLNSHGSISRGATFSFTWPSDWRTPAEVSDLSMAPLESEEVVPAVDEGPTLGHKLGHKLSFDPESTWTDVRPLSTHVLVVDADAGDRAALVSALTRRGLGAWCHQTNSAQRALLQLRSLCLDHPLQSVLVLLGLGVDGPGGLPLIDQIRADAVVCGTPIFVLSSALNAEDRQRLAHKYVAAVIDKAQVRPGFEAVAALVSAYGLATRR